MFNRVLHGDTASQFIIQDTITVKFSGIVVTYNDDRRLAECLSALNFCDELIVIDLGSEDQSRQIAMKFGARVIQHKWVQAVEYVREFAISQTKHQWVVFMDPDMIFPVHLVSTIIAKIQQDTSLGVIYIPYRNYFFGKPIKYGRWGERTNYPAVFRRNAVDCYPIVHRGFRGKSDFHSIVLGNTELDVIKHFWADSIDHLYQKANRYIPLEGPARYKNGERFSFKRLFFEVPYAVFDSLFVKRGFLDGWRGVYLSFFYGWLTWNYLLSLRDYQYVDRKA